MLVLVVFALWFGFLLCWLVWSRSIFRRRHRRTTPVSYEVSFAEDSLGRRVAVEPRTALAHRVVVSVSGPGVKAYEAVDKPSKREEDVA